MLADGTVLELAGLANATAISDRGEIAGTSTGRMLAVLRDGVLTEIPAPDLPQAAGDVVWSVKDIDETGRMAAVATWRISSPGRPPSVNPSREYLYEPSTGLRRLSDAVTGDPEQPFDFVQVGVTRITAGNRLLAPTAVLVPEGAAGPIDGSAAAGSPTSATVGGDGLYVTAVNQDGTAVVLRLTGTGWEGQELPGVPGPPAVVVRDVITYTDARDGRAYAVVLMGVDLAWFVQNESGVFERRGALPLDRGVQFTGPLTTFTSADGRVHIVGTLGSGGHVAMAFQTNLAAPDSIQNWNYVNLSLTHLEVQGIEAPSFAGPLTAYATRWGGMNIAGLDAAGDIRVIWWGPGLTYWRTNNLSEIAGTPALTGRLASMVTSWDGLTLTGVGADTGELWSTWWVPSFGDRWRADSLSGAAASDLEFDPDSITAYVTDWGGQNIAGRNAQTGEIAVYWWAPATDVWTAEAITVAGDVGVPVSTGPLLSLADGQSLNLFLRTADLTGQGGDILRLFWRAADNVWLFENLTHAVSAAGGA